MIFALDGRAIPMGSPAFFIFYQFFLLQLESKYDKIIV